LLIKFGLFAGYLRPYTEKEFFQKVAQPKKQSVARHYKRVLPEVYIKM